MYVFINFSTLIIAGKPGIKFYRRGLRNCIRKLLASYSTGSADLSPRHHQCTYVLRLYLITCSEYFRDVCEECRSGVSILCACVNLSWLFLSQAIESYQKEYALLKKPRKIHPAPQLGQVGP